MLKINKKPKFVNLPSKDKTPRADVPFDIESRLEFKTEQMDFEGLWGWNNFESDELQGLLNKIFEMQKLTWQLLYQKGSHLVRVMDLDSKAQKRLREIGKDDLDELYSLRLTGQRRVWGIKERAIFWLLWWDPKHTVCKSRGADN